MTDSKRLKDLALEALALASSATPGPWKYDIGNGQIETEDKRIELFDLIPISSRIDDINYMYGEGDDHTKEIIDSLKDPFCDGQLVEHAGTHYATIAQAVLDLMEVKTEYKEALLKLQYDLERSNEQLAKMGSTLKNLAAGDASDGAENGCGCDWYEHCNHWMESAKKRLASLKKGDRDAS